MLVCFSVFLCVVLGFILGFFFCLHTGAQQALKQEIVPRVLKKIEDINAYSNINQDEFIKKIKRIYRLK